MPTFRQLALRVIAESGLEKEPKDDLLSPEHVFLWLKARYQTIIDAMPFGAVTQQPPLIGATVAMKTTGVVNVVNGSSTVTGVGTNFVAGDFPTDGAPMKVFRTLGSNIYYFITAVNVGSQTLTLDTPYQGATENGIIHGIVTPYYTVPTVRWITSLIRDDYGEMEEYHITKLSEVDPNRSLLPGPPRAWSKRFINPGTGQRYVELYPFPDDVYRVTVYGYSNFEEPLITSSPHREIDSECFVVGAMASAFEYRAQLAVGRKEVESATLFRALAKDKRIEFDTYVKQLSNRDNHDVAQPRVRVRLTQDQSLLGPVRDHIIDAYSEVWNRP
jgi:hypothetical protein